MRFFAIEVLCGISWLISRTPPGYDVEEYRDAVPITRAILIRQLKQVFDVEPGLDENPGVGLQGAVLAEEGYPQAAVHVRAAEAFTLQI